MQRAPADLYASALHHRGLRPGATLGVAVRPGPRALAVLLAAWRLGLRAAVLDPGAGPDVPRARLALAGPTWCWPPEQWCCGPARSTASATRTWCRGCWAGCGADCCCSRGVTSSSV
ncbi:hypothetical protein AB0939_23040 [Streptomyces sp. NPDC006990]|uniref:hypothetical protein n=1 Tax=Streptomyces sp. NPDC006990 TaxID=3154481 RepID=UPI0034550303